MRISIAGATALLLTLSRSLADPIRGVNLGGWLLTEQWITPSVFSSTGTGDEWSLCAALGKDKCLKALRGHWGSFLDRSDFEAIKAAGLNAVRIPVGYWAVDVLAYEPYVSGQYPYLIQAVQWAGELGLSVLVDLHGVPGSQNGQDNSGLIGPVLFAQNTSNAERSLTALRNLTEEFSRPIYNGAVTGIELMNEPRVSTNASSYFPMNDLKDFYTSGAEVIRAADPTINVTIHDAFYGPSYWAGYNPYTNSSFTPTAPPDHLALDTHQYYAFAPTNTLTRPQMIDAVCGISQLLKEPHSQSNVPYTLVGEWSLQTGQQDSHHQDSDDDQAQRTWFRLLFEAQKAAYEPNGAGQSSIGWFYWTWTTEWDIDTWSYRRGLADGYVPSDVSNATTLAFPIMGNGCVDAGFAYEAPRQAGDASGMRGLRLTALWWVTVTMTASYNFAPSAY